MVFYELLLSSIGKPNSMVELKGEFDIECE